MDNHLHVLVRLDGDAAKAWSAEEVVRRWIEVYPPKSATGEEIEVVQAWIGHQAQDEKRVELLRHGERLQLVADDSGDRRKAGLCVQPRHVAYDR